MKQIRKFGIVTLALLAGFACEDEDKAPIVTFDSATKGAYVRLLTQGDNLMNVLTQTTFSASSYVYSVEFVDLNQGGLVSQYVLDLEYQDADDVNTTTITGFMTFDAGSFATNDNGFKELADISISSDALIAAAGITYADIAPGDNFRIEGSLVMNDGSVRDGDDSSASVNGAAFQGHFGFDLPAGCPSDLAQTVNVSTDLPNFCATSTTGTVDILAEGAGQYGFSDWSFNGYPTCYGGFCCATGTFNFKDVCEVVTLNNGIDSFGDAWEFSSVISGNDWIITFGNVGNCTQEQGVATLNFPDGVPFTVTN